MTRHLVDPPIEGRSAARMSISTLRPAFQLTRCCSPRRRRASRAVTRNSGSRRATDHDDQRIERTPAARVQCAGGASVPCVARSRAADGARAAAKLLPRATNAVCRIRRSSFLCARDIIRECCARFLRGPGLSSSWVARPTSPSKIQVRAPSRFRAEAPSNRTRPSPLHSRARATAIVGSTSTGASALAKLNT